MQSKQFRRRQKLNNQRGVQRSSSDIIEYHRSTGKSWSNTSPNNNGECGGDGGGGGGGSGGEKNCHTLRFYRVAPTLAVECSTLYTASASSASAHPSNDRKDEDESGGRGGTHHHCSDCDDVAGYPRRHISRDHD